MVRRRSTVRFRNGAPAQRNNSNISNRPWGPFRGPNGPGSSHHQGRPGIARFWSAELCDPGSSLMDLLDGAEDHRRGALDGPAHQVPWAVAVMDLGEPPARPARARRPGWWSCHSRSARWKARTVQARTRRRRTSARPRSSASMMAQEWWATSRHSMASACWVSRRYRAPSSGCRPVTARPGA